MIKKRIKKIFKLSILIFFRQAWKLLCNIYHLLTEPFWTIKNLIKEKDKSQIFLLTGTIFMPILAYISARIIWDMHKYGFMVNSVGTIFAIVMIVETLIFLYLGFWTFQAFKKK
jgi:uncharacterized membrane protein YwzB